MTIVPQALLNSVRMRRIVMKPMPERADDAKILYVMGESDQRRTCRKWL